MSIDLKEPIATYFRAKSSGQHEEVLACFSENAVVNDTGENAVLTGKDQILQWLSGTIADYNLSTEILRHEDQGETTTVTALVSGDFPGSPIEFDYDFVVQEGKIARLTIR